MNNRRDFLRASLAGVGALMTDLAAGRSTLPRRFSSMAAPGGPEPTKGWAEVAGILSRIRPPVFPDRDFEITKFGAVGDGRTDCTDAFRRAISACHEAGGGRVLVSRGEFSSGAIRLLSGVNLHLEPGSTIRFSHDVKKYPLVLTRWEGVEVMNFSPLLYAFEQENIAITGAGTIDGNADCEHWWSWKGIAPCGKSGTPSQEEDRNRLFEMAERGVPVPQRVFGEGHYLRPQLIQPYRCKSVLIEGVTVLHSPMWHVHPALCSNVTVRGLTIQSSGPNTDGCNPDSSSDVLIENCTFDTGDDCIAIKSGRNADGRRVNVPAQNIVVRGCHMKGGHGGVTVGSEVSGGVNHVFAEGCQMDSPHLDVALRIKSNAMRGGAVEHFYARNIDVGEVARAGLSIDLFYEEGQNGSFPPIVRDVEVRNLKAKEANCALYLRGFPQDPIQDVRLENCDFDGTVRPDVIENVKGLSLQGVRENGKLVQHSA